MRAENQNIQRSCEISKQNMDFNDISFENAAEFQPGDTPSFFKSSSTGKTSNLQLDEAGKEVEVEETRPEHADDVRPTHQLMKGSGRRDQAKEVPNFVGKVSKAGGYTCCVLGCYNNTKKILT